MGPEDSIDAIKLLEPQAGGAVPLQHVAADRSGRGRLGRARAVAYRGRADRAGTGRTNLAVVAAGDAYQRALSDSDSVIMAFWSYAVGVYHH